MQISHGNEQNPVRAGRATGRSLSRPSCPEEIAARTVLAQAGRAKKRGLWPAPVRDIVKGVFVQHRRLVGAFKFPVEIRSRSGHGYFAMGSGQVGRGKSRDDAISALIRFVDPAVEEVVCR